METQLFMQIKSMLINLTKGIFILNDEKYKILPDDTINLS